MIPRTRPRTWSRPGRPAIAIRLGACVLVAIAGLAGPPEARGQTPADTIACRFDGPPTVTSLSYPEARRVLERCKFVADSVGRPSSERPGTVLDQRTIAREGDVGDRRVELVVAVPPFAPIDTMPRLVGRSRSDAERLAVLFKLRPRFRERSSESTPSGVVDAQRPSAGADVPNGRVVEVWVSTGPPGVRVPDLENRTVEEARRILASVRLRFGGASLRESDRPEGRIVEQTPPPDSLVPMGHPVEVFVSTGPRTVLVPPVVNFTRQAAFSALVARGLVVGAVDLEPDPTRVPGTVTGQFPEANTEVPPGSSVDLVLARPGDPGGPGAVDEGDPDSPAEESVSPTEEETRPADEGGDPVAVSETQSAGENVGRSGGVRVVALSAPALIGRTLDEARVRAGPDLIVAVASGVTWPGADARIGGQVPEPGVTVRPGEVIRVTPEQGWPLWVLVLLGAGAAAVAVSGGQTVKHRVWPRVAVRPIPGMVGPDARVADPKGRIERTIRLRFDGGPTVSRIRRSGATDGS